MDFYEFMEQCKEEGLMPEEAIREWHRAEADRAEAWMEAYDDDPEVQYGWHQQDVIDMYRRER